MSIWAEIKKAINSNLNKPLDKLITENIHIKRGITSGKEGEIFSVSSPKGGIINSAYFPAFYMDAKSTETFTFILKVDGVEYFKINLSQTNGGSSSNASSQCGLISANNLAYGEGKFIDTSIFRTLNNSTPSIERENILNYEYDNTYESTNSGSALGYTYAFVMSNPIRFNNSFSLSVINSSNKNIYNNYGSTFNGVVSYGLFD